MSAVKKATLYVDYALHKAARIHAAETDQSVSDVVNEALAIYFAELQDDLNEIKKRKNEARIPMDAVLKKLKSDGLI